MPAEQVVALGSARKGPDGLPLVDLKPVGEPSDLPHLLIANIDDQAKSAKDRVLSTDVAAAKLDLGALAFDPRPGRYLAVLVAGRNTLPPVTATGAGSLSAACGKACAMTSGWIEIVR